MIQTDIKVGDTVAWEIQGYTGMEKVAPRKGRVVHIEAQWVVVCAEGVQSFMCPITTMPQWELKLAA
jgi:hypothetical protein